MNEYFVKQNQGLIWHFYCNEKGICFCNLTGNKLNEYELLVPGGQSDFDITLDKNDTIHLACQNSSGEILYFKYEEHQWKKYVVLKSKNQTNYEKGFKIIQSRNDINLFYTIRYNGKWMLTRQIINSSAVPVIVDYIVGRFDAVCDESENIYLLYTNEQKNQLGRRKITNINDVGPFAEIKVSDNIFNPHILINNGNVHVCGTTENGRVVYVKNEQEKFLDFEAKDALLTLKENTVFIMWMNEATKQIMYSSDGNKASTFMAGRYISPKLFSYVESDKNIRKGNCYGYINNNAAAFYLFNDFFERKNTSLKKELKEFDELKKRISTLENELKELKGKIGSKK